MAALYPALEPYNSFMMPRGLHEIYVEEAGNPKGQPVVFVHGGPGGGTDPGQRRFFDPQKWRIILFDQRGCGRSTPFGELTQNTTWDLVADMEEIREQLKISKWHVFGGSWGSTLSLTYAINHADRVFSLVLRGIFLVRRSEINWFYQQGASYFYPAEWQDYLALIPKAERGDLLLAYHRRLTSADQAIVKQAAIAWSRWEGATSKLRQNNSMIANFSDDHFAYAFARIENHYFINKAFFNEDNYLLNNINKIKHIPGYIIQGRYDMPCPPISAYDLHKAWPKAEFIIVEEAGHSASEPGITSALVDATNQLVAKL